MVTPKPTIGFSIFYYVSKSVFPASKKLYHFCLNDYTYIKMISVNVNLKLTIYSALGHLPSPGIDTFDPAYESADYWLMGLKQFIWTGGKY